MTHPDIQKLRLDVQYLERQNKRLSKMLKIATEALERSAAGPCRVCSYGDDCPSGNGWVQCDRCSARRALCEIERVR